MEPLQWLGAFLGGSWLAFLLVLARVVGLVVALSGAVPFAMPLQLRAAFSLVLAVALAPVLSATAPASLWDLGVGLLAEGLTGLGLGLGVGLLFLGLQLAGALVGQLTGLSAAEARDPAGAVPVTVLSHWFGLLGIAVFLAVGGHRVLIEGLLESCRLIPPGRGFCGETMLAMTLELLQVSYLFALRVAAPTIVSVVIGGLAVALLARTAPVVDVIATAAGGKLWLGLAALLLSCGALVWVLPEVWEEMIDKLANLAAAAPRK